MATQNYQLTTFGKFTNTEARAVYDELASGGESRDYLDLMITILVEQNQGIREFGREAAKELLLLAIAKGYFDPGATK